MISLNSCSNACKIGAGLRSLILVQEYLSVNEFSFEYKAFAYSVFMEESFLNICRIAGLQVYVSWKRSASLPKRTKLSGSSLWSITVDGLSKKCFSLNSNTHGLVF